jgi:hypothetical protein
MVNTQHPINATIITNIPSTRKRRKSTKKHTSSKQSEIDERRTPL